MPQLWVNLSEQLQRNASNNLVIVLKTRYNVPHENCGSLGNEFIYKPCRRLHFASKQRSANIC